MNIWVLILGISLSIVLIFSIWQYILSKKKLLTISDELKFFKKEKEYYEEAMLLLSQNYNIVYANQAAKNLFSLNDKNEIVGIGKKIQLQVNSGTREDFFIALEKFNNASEDNIKLDNIYLIISGHETKIDLFLDKSASNIDGNITCVIDIKNSHAIETNEVKDGAIDFLTGLPSQFLALSDINTLVIESKKKSKPFGIFLLGIDHFNDIQTTLGLGYTNKILKNIAQYFIDNPKENIRVYRMEADKFVFLINELDEDELARSMARDIIASVGSIYVDNNDIRLTCSIGIVIYPKDGENAAKLINHVYIALDRAQKESESNIAFFTTEFQVMHKDELKMNEEIQAGLKNHEFFLYYQPIFNLKTEEMIGAEALIRWNHPKLGLITADKFLEVAKKTGLIIDIGEYAFREAIKQRKVWNDEGLKKFKITLNLSLKEMQVDKLVQKLETLFKDHSIDPRDFNLDITEKSAMANVERTALDFKLFKDLGLSLSLDHFGEGASSLKHLQMLPLSMIKIDRSLIFDLYSNLDHQITVKSMITLIHSLGFEAVAEGVETSKESALLYDFGCDHAQGYLFSKPLPAKELHDLLK